jgi:hypothetical protein
LPRVEIASQSWGWIADSAGNAVRGLAVQIQNLDGTAATHWDAITGGTSSTMTLLTAADGTIPGYLEAGTYGLTVTGVGTHRVEAVAGITNAMVFDWTANTFYRNNTVIRDAAGNLQRAVTDHNSGATFNQANWMQILLPGETISVGGGLRGEVVPAAEPALWGLASRTFSFTGRTWLLRCVPKRTRLVTLARWDVTLAATADDQTEVAVYTGDLSSRIATSGVQSGQLNGLGVKGVNLAVAVDPSNVYYVAWKAPVSLGGTGATVNGRSCNSTSATQLFGTTVPTALAGFVDGLSSPLPTSINAASVNWTALNTFPFIVLREV